MVETVVGDFFKLGLSFYMGLEPRSLAWLAFSTGQSATTYTTVAITLENYWKQYLIIATVRMWGQQTYHEQITLKI